MRKPYMDWPAHVQARAPSRWLKGMQGTEHLPPSSTACERSPTLLACRLKAAGARIRATRQAAAAPTCIKGDGQASGGFNELASSCPPPCRHPRPLKALPRP